MKVIQDYITEKQADFSKHSFFERLESLAPLSEVLPFAKAMTFWIMNFQDILRLNETRVTEPMLKKIAASHKAEDAGHEQWFLSDLQKLEGGGLPEVDFLFSRAHAGVRDASYALVAEVFNARTDIERIVLVLALESTGHVFFERISTYLEESRFPLYNQLRYFSRKHLNVELDHDVFEDEKEQYLRSLQLSPELEQACKAVVDRAYVAFTAMFDHVESVIRRSQQQTPAAQQPAARAHLAA